MPSQRPKPIVSARPQRIACTHHWVLPEPTGDSMTGVCKRCGAKREFPVSMPWGFRGSASPRS